MMNVLINVSAQKSCYKVEPRFAIDTALGLPNSSLGLR